MSSHVTNEDRARGWAELQVAFIDGGSETVRVHTPEISDLIRCIAKVLRVEREVAARVSTYSQLEIMITLSSLLHGDVAAAAITKKSVKLTAEKPNG